LGLDAAVDDDEGMGLKKLMIEPFLTGLVVSLSVFVVDSVVCLVSSATIFGSGCAMVSVFLDADVSKDVASLDMRRFFVLDSFGESSRMLLLPYVRSGFARGRPLSAGLEGLLRSVSCYLYPIEHGGGIYISRFFAFK
jgi:hypothetical protein